MDLNHMIIEMLVKERNERLLENAKLASLYSISPRARNKSPGMIGRIALRAAKLMIYAVDRIKARYEPAI